MAILIVRFDKKITSVPPRSWFFWKNHRSIVVHDNKISTKKQTDCTKNRRLAERKGLFIMKGLSERRKTPDHQTAVGRFPYG